MGVELPSPYGRSLCPYEGQFIFIRKKLQFHTEETTRLRGEYLVLGMRFAFYFGCLPLSLLVLVGMSDQRQ